jgi:hypothetical protein
MSGERRQTNDGVQPSISSSEANKQSSPKALRLAGVHSAGRLLAPVPSWIDQILAKARGLSTAPIDSLSDTQLRDILTLRTIIRRQMPRRSTVNAVVTADVELSEIAETARP